jgi:hypothetical protein
MWHVRGDRRGAKRASVRKTEGNKTFGNSKRRELENTKMLLEDTGWESGLGWSVSV